MNQHGMVSEQPSQQEALPGKEQKEELEILASPEAVVESANQQVADLSRDGNLMLGAISSETTVSIDTATEGEMEAIRAEAGQAVEDLKESLVEGSSQIPLQNILLYPEQHSSTEYEQALNTLIETDPASVYRLPSFDRLNPEQRREVSERVLEVSPIDIFVRGQDLFLLPEQFNRIVDRAVKGDVDLGFELLSKKSSVSSEKRAQIFESLKQKTPIQLLHRSYKANFSEEEKQSLIKTLLDIDPAELLRASDVGDSLSKDQIQIVVSKLVAENPLLVMNHIDKWSLTSEEQEQIAGKIILESQAINSNTLIELLSRYPALVPALIQENVGLPEGRAKDLVMGLSDRFIYSFEVDPQDALNANVKNRTSAMVLFEQLSEEERQNTLPSLIEHASDADFGDPQLLQVLLGKVKDPLERADLERRASTSESLSERIEAFQKDLAPRSEQNRRQMHSALTEAYGEERVDAVMKEVERSMFFSVNCSFKAVEGVLKSGGLQSMWGKIKNGRPGDYAEARHAAERSLGIRAKGTEKDPHPVYGAVGYANGKDELRGAAPGYGEVFLKLKMDAVRERGSFTCGDSLNGSTASRQFNYQDVAIARTNAALDGRQGYAELQLLGGATLEDIESINLPSSEVVDGRISGTSIEELREKYPGINFNII